MITFKDFDEILIPLARRFKRTISNDEKPGELNQYWSIGCGSKEGYSNDYWPCIDMKREWRTACLTRGFGWGSEWLEDLSVAVSIIAIGEESRCKGF
jgi:hypothetical protein